MSLLATKLYLPAPPPNLVPRPRLVERLNAGLHRKLTLVSAAAGAGKTTLLSEWLAGRPRPAAWLSLDERDSDPARFLTYLVAALQSVDPALGQGVLAALSSPQPPPAEALLTALLNDLAAAQGRLILVLDDYHLVDDPAVDDALAFMVERLPPQLHLVIATREDPALPLPRLRARGQLAELRITDLRFTPAEAAGFLNQAMGLELSAAQVAALETRTEGWIAGLQLAALALQSLPSRIDAAGFIDSFTGSHHFILDYLMEEVLGRQPPEIQAFLLRTAILDRLCGPLCDAMLEADAGSGQAALETIECSNLFIIPLDDQRRWYRYHHLFADLLRQRLQHSASGGDGASLAACHLRASAWFEANGLDLEAFQHAVAAGDIDRAARLVEGQGMPLIFRGAAVPVVHWLETLSQAALDARPALWVIYASALLFVNQVAGVEAKLQAAEAVLPPEPADPYTRDLLGHIASIRATVAVIWHDAAAILAQSQRALAYLHPANLPVRTATTWTLGYAYYLQGDRAAARQAYTEAQAISEKIGHFIILLMSTQGLAQVQEDDLQLPLAAETYTRAVQLAGDPPTPVACNAHLGLARIHYAWNDLQAARQHAGQAALLAQQIPNTDRYVACQVFLARLGLASGDLPGAAAILARAEAAARQQDFSLQLPEIAAARSLLLLRQGQPEAAAQLASEYALPLSQAQARLESGDAGAALAVLEPFCQALAARGWHDQRLQGLLLLALARRAVGQTTTALHTLAEALALAEPGGVLRPFIEAGEPLARLLAAAPPGTLPGIAVRLQAVMNTHPAAEAAPAAQPLIEPLTPRELEILRLVAGGLSNRQIGEQLFLALDTVKGHNQRIFDKLGVQRRTEAVARARQLGLV